MVEHTFNVSMWEAEANYCKSESSLVYITSSRWAGYIEKYYLKNKTKTNPHTRKQQKLFRD